MEQAVFLDRDGVLNRAEVRGGKPYPPARLEEFEILDGVKEAVSLLRNRGYRLIVATNQPDVGTGKQQREVVEAMHGLLHRQLGLDDIAVCYHTDSDQCSCRKPLPGMLVEFARKWSIDLGQSYLVGDRWRDIEAGRRAGCRTFFIDYQYQERRPDRPDWVVHSLLEASRIIVSLSSLSSGGTCT